jgi:hypothetical protein
MGEKYRQCREGGSEARRRSIGNIGKEAGWGRRQGREVGRVGKGGRVWKEAGYERRQGREIGMG